MRVIDVHVVICSYIYYLFINLIKILHIMRVLVWKRTRYLQLLTVAHTFSPSSMLFKVALQVTIKPDSQTKSKKDLIHLSVKMEYLLVSMAIS